MRNVLLVNRQFSANKVEGLIAKLKPGPETPTYASSGNGTPLHLSGELFKFMTRNEMVHLP